MIFAGLTPERVFSEYLSAERYQECCDQIWSTDKRAGKATDKSPPKAGALLYAKADHTLPLFEQLKKRRARVTLVTAESDVTIDEQRASTAPPQIGVWFSTNAAAKGVRPLPLGLGNSYCQVTNKAPALAEALAAAGAERSKLLYVNFRASTNPAVREPLLAAYGSRLHEPWLTVRHESVAPPDFLREMTQHKFVLCPAGNGLDSHRIWEALYTGTIPVVQHHTVLRDFHDLPIMFVDDLAKVRDEDLRVFLKDAAGRPWNVEKLFVPYWACALSQERAALGKSKVSLSRFISARLPRCPRVKRGTERGISALFLSDGRSLLSEAQFEPFQLHRHQLRTTLGFSFRCKRLHMERFSSGGGGLAKFDLIGLKFDYRTPQDSVLHVAREIARLKRPDAKLVYMDGNDEITIQWPQLLEVCDIYWKKQLPTDLVDAVRDYQGGTNLTQYVGGRCPGDAMPRLWDLSALGKVLCAPSIALNDKISSLSNLLEDEEVIGKTRPVDVILRAEVPENWMGSLRRPAVRVLEALGADFRVIQPTERVTPTQYAEEMQAAKICLSPFGYGEICYRDYEAALHGCLLFKPNMSHVHSEADIFRPFETYVPVNWDYSDLGEKVARYTGDDAERLRIVGNARRVLREALQPEWFVAKVEELLKAAGFR